MIVKMVLADAAIGDEQALPAEPQSDALGDAGERRGKRRPDGAVEDPKRAQALPAQQRDEPDQIGAALNCSKPSRPSRRRFIFSIPGRNCTLAPLVGATKNVT
jgi:hypothetical protein